MRLRPDARLPERASAGATGLDLFACLGQGCHIDVGPDPVLVGTGLALEPPPGYDVQIRPRSGLSRLGVIATFGTIDADYRGEILVTLYCVGSRTTYRLRHGDRIAQLVVTPLAPLPVLEVSKLSETERGTGGHGSTGR